MLRKEHSIIVFYFELLLYGLHRKRHEMQNRVIFNTKLRRKPSQAALTMVTVPEPRFRAAVTQRQRTRMHSSRSGILPRLLPLFQSAGRLGFAWHSTAAGRSARRAAIQMEV